MENASKALLIAGGVLIGIIMLTLIVTFFQKAGNETRTYNKAIHTEEITIFNNNFTQYIGKNLTIHDVITICNFAKNNKIKKVTVINGKEVKDINNETLNKSYNINKITYSDDGYISTISFY